MIAEITLLMIVGLRFTTCTCRRPRALVTFAWVCVLGCARARCSASR